MYLIFSVVKSLSIKVKKLTARITCAGSLTLLIVRCEQSSVVCPREVHVPVHLRQTRIWQIQSQTESLGQCPHTSLITNDLKWLRAYLGLGCRV